MLLKRIVVPLLLLVVWLVMNENFSVESIVIGFAVVTLILFSANLLLDYNYAKTFYLPVLKFLKYIVFMVGQIYLSGIKASYRIITGKIKPGFVKCKIDKKIDSPYIQNIIASSITLTPGTITVDKQEDKLTVLSLHSNDGKSPCSSFEPQLIKMNKKLKDKRR